MKTENQVAKPTSMLREEFINTLSILINESQLPMFVIEPVLKDMYTDVKILAQRQLENDKNYYQKTIEELEHKTSIAEQDNIS